MKRLGWIAGILGAIVIVAYLLFEPIFRLPFGWRDFAPDEAPPAVVEGVVTPSLEAKMRSLYDAGGRPSLSAAIATGEGVRWAMAIGHQDVEGAVPATVTTRYRLGSTSKVVNATVAARLVAQDAVELDAPIDRYIDYFPDKGAPITLRQLLSHTAGIPHYGTCLCLPIWEYEIDRAFASVEEAVGVFADKDLLFEPGTDFSYSTYGTVLSSAVMEAAAGADYLTLVEREVAQPLGLESLGPDRAGDPLASDVVLYESVDGALRRARVSDDSMKWAGGGFVATPSDVARLGAAWAVGDVVSDDLRAVFLTPQELADGTVNEQNYALGFRVGTIEDRTGRSYRIIHHNGMAKGGTSSFLAIPELGIGISVMTNRAVLQGDRYADSGLAWELAQIVIDERAGQSLN